MIRSAAIVYQLSYQWYSAHINTWKQCKDKYAMTFVSKVRYRLQTSVPAKKRAGDDLLTRNYAFTSIVRTTADAVTALKANVCRGWQMSHHVPNFGAF